MEKQDPLQELNSLAESKILFPEDRIYLDSRALKRFLVARDYNVEKALEMWEKWVQWRKEYRADQITEQEMMPHIQTGKAFYHGKDAENRPCLIFRVRYHYPNQASLEDTMRYCIYLIEKGCQLADELGSGQICVIYDRGEITSANKDNRLIDAIKSLSGMLQDFYAERLGAVYVLHVNWFYWLMFQAAKPFMQKKTRKKVQVLRNPNNLLNFFDKSELLEEYGGTSSYSHPYPVN